MAGQHTSTPYLQAVVESDGLHRPGPQLHHFSRGSDLEAHTTEYGCTKHKGKKKHSSLVMLPCLQWTELHSYQKRSTSRKLHTLYNVFSLASVGVGMLAGNRSSATLWVGMLNSSSLMGIRPTP